MVNKEKCLDYFDEEKFEKTIDCFDQLLADDPDNIELIYNKGLALLENEDFEKAIKCFDDVLKQDPNNINVINDKGASLLALGNYEGAEKYFNMALKLDPKFIISLFSKGNLYLDTENYSEALDYYKKTVKIAPDFVEAWFNYGLCLFLLESYSDAIPIFDKTIELDPEYSNAWYFKGSCLEVLEDYDEALKMYSETLKLNPKDSEFYNAKGRILRNTEKLVDALKLFDKALELDPENESAIYNKANTLNLMGKQQLALAHFQEVVKIDPEYEDAWFEMGLISDILGNKKDALSNFKKVNEINPSNVAAWYDQGLMYRELKKYENALECFNKAIKLDPEYFDAWYQKGNVLRDLQKETQAIKAYQKFVDIVEKNNVSDWKLTAKRVKEFIRISNEGEEVFITPPQEPQFWQWVTKAEFFLEPDGNEREDLDPAHGSDPGGYWTCHKDTRVGDLILLYRAGKKDGVTYQDIKYLIQVESDAYTIDFDEFAFEHGWQYGCDYKPLFKFDKSLSYKELSEDPYLEEWNALRKRFQGIAFRTEERHWNRLQKLLTEKNPQYENFLKGFKPKEIQEIDFSEKLVEEKLSKNLHVLKKFGYNLKFLGRQVRCIGQGGRIDLFCQDKNDGSLVIIELKIVKATRNTFGQISNYIGWAIKRNAKGRKVKGIVISKGYDNEFDSALLTNNDINHIELADVLDKLGVKLK